MDTLKKKIYHLYNMNQAYNLEEYNELIRQCVVLYEMSAVVFLYDNMKHHKITPNKETFKLINKLHSKTCPENNLLVIKDQNIGKLKPRRRIHKIMKGYNYGGNYSNALKNVELVKSHVILNPETRKYNRIKLAKNISNNCNISFDDARYIITHLKKTKFLIDYNVNYQKSITDFFP